MRTTTNSASLLTCVEHSTIDVRVADLLDEAGNLQIDLEARDRGYFSVNLQRGGQLSLRAGHHVGLIPLSHELALHVTPRVPLANLTRLVDIARVEPRTLQMVRAYTPETSQNSAIRDLLARGLLASLGELSLRGMLRTYARREEVSSNPRGAFDFAETVKRHAREQTHLAGYRWFEREVDNAANRCLLLALYAITAQYPTASDLNDSERQLVASLNAYRYIFQGVQLDRRRSFLADPIVRGLVAVPSTRAYYREGLDVALAILERSGLSLDGTEGRLRLPSVVFDMSEVFEGFIRNCLANFADADGWPVSVGDGNGRSKRALFASSQTISDQLGQDPIIAPHHATPDLTFETEAGNHPLIGEIKYIPLGRKAYLREAVDQATTYADVYECDRVLIVHPWSEGGPRGLSSPGRVGTVDVWIYRFDLSATDLDQEIVDFGAAVRPLVIA